eukprot:6895646-Prymnesium_polylepis.1
MRSAWRKRRGGGAPARPAALSGGDRVAALRRRKGRGEPDQARGPTAPEKGSRHAITSESALACGTQASKGSGRMG